MTAHAPRALYCVPTRYALIALEAPRRAPKGRGNPKQFLAFLSGSSPDPSAEKRKEGEELFWLLRRYATLKPKVYLCNVLRFYDHARNATC